MFPRMFYIGAILVCSPVGLGDLVDLVDGLNDSISPIELLIESNILSRENGSKDKYDWIDFFFSSILSESKQQLQVIILTHFKI